MLKPKSAEKSLAAMTTAAILLGEPSPASAFCMYHGVLYAKTTISQEYIDSKWVVRARVRSATDHFSDDDDSWTIYELAVEHRYKGQPPDNIRLFTYRNSGGFYMDRPWAGLSAGHDIGGRYLLFLNPIPSSDKMPVAARGAEFVNYSCGQSVPWKKVTASSRRLLVHLQRSR